MQILEFISIAGIQFKVGFGERVLILCETARFCFCRYFLVGANCQLVQLNILYRPLLQDFFEAALKKSR
jgi:hypothetical protein